MITEKKIHGKDDIGDGRVLAEFFAPWCSFCRAAEPILSDVEREFPETEFIKINTDECQDAAAAFDVRSLPTFILFEGGKERARAKGALNIAELRRMLRS